MVRDQTSINHRKGIGLFVLVSLLVLYLPTRATNFISTWILSTFCCPLKEIADTLWHELAPDWVILPHPWDFMFKGAPDFSLCTSFPFAPLPPVGFFLSELCRCHSSVGETSASRPLSDGQVLAASDGVICHKCAKTWLIGEMSSKVVENSRAPRIEKRGPHFHSSRVLTDGPSSHFPSFLYCVPQLVYVLHPPPVDLFSTWSQCLPPLEKNNWKCWTNLNWAIRDAARCKQWTRTSRFLGP